MSSNNNDNGAAMGLAFAFAILAFIGMFVFAVLAFLACILTVLAVLAWNKPLRLGKKWTLEPEEARAFILRGVLGAGVLPVFVAFCSALFSFHINWDYLPHIIGAGYVAGSIGLEILMADENGNNVPTQNPAPPQWQLPAPPPKTLPRAEADSFRFASWDDEDERK